MVIPEDGKPMAFEEESTLFRSIDEAQKDEFLDFYAPVSFNDDKEKRRMNREYATNLHEIVESVIRAQVGPKEEES